MIHQVLVASSISCFKNCQVFRVLTNKNSDMTNIDAAHHETLILLPAISREQS